MTKEINKKEYKGGKLSEIIIISLVPFLASLKRKGIKQSVAEFIPDVDIDKFVVGKIRKQLLKRRGVEISNGFIGRVDIQYRYDGIQIEPTGLLRLLVKKITITDAKILESLNSILKQIEEKYIINDEYIINKIDEIVASFSEKGIYKPKNSEEKTLYDLAMLILLNYYNLSNEVPDWIKPALTNISKGKFLRSWIASLLDYISEVIAQVSENIFFNFKVTFDSYLVRKALNKKTNKGQLSSLLKMMNIDIKEIIYDFAKKYISPSFIKGIGEILVDISGTFLSTVNKELSIQKKLKVDLDSQRLFDITILPGKNFCFDRFFRWHTARTVKNSFLEFSYDISFENSKKVKSECETVSRTIPTINLGLIAGYKVIELNRHSVHLKDLSPGTVYYKIHCDEYESEVYKFKIREIKQDFEFTLFTDSQGMVKQDYDIFAQVVESASKDSNSDFIVHLGDFVDDGNNEEYWNWVLSARPWKENVCIPLGGNHESRKNAVAFKAGVQDAIIEHFNVQGLNLQKAHKGIYYSFEVGNATFVVLSTNFNEGESCLDTVQYQWAISVLKDSKSTWKIILSHKSPYSNGAHCNDSDVKKFREQISELAYQGGVDVVFSGHDHVYARTPILSCSEEVGCEKVIIEKGNLLRKKFINPYGTIFVVPGTSGVKNYNSEVHHPFPLEVSPKLEDPVYSKIKISDSGLEFKAYMFNTKTNLTKIIDSFSIEKLKGKTYQLDSNYASRLISSIPDVPWMDNSVGIKKALCIYNSLSYSEKIKVKNSEHFFTLVRLNKNYLDIISKSICRVKTKSEFLAAISDKTVGTIIVECDEIKFENKFSFKGQIIIDRSICISGCAKLVQVSFILKGRAVLTLSEGICIDNSRKITSIYPARTAFELHNNSILILNDNVSVNAAFGVGNKGLGINVLGEGCLVYLNSSSCNFTRKPFLKALSLNSKIKVNSGKYFSSGNKSAFLVNCSLTIRGGFIKNIKGLECSKISIEGGIVGEKDKSKLNVPIESHGKVRLLSGSVRACEGVSVLIHGNGNEFKNNVSLSSGVDIDGEIIYN